LSQEVSTESLIVSGRCQRLQLGQDCGRLHQGGGPELRFVQLRYRDEQPGASVVKRSFFDTDGMA